MAQTPRLGKMRTRVLIKELRDTAGTDEMGGRSDALVTVAERWANVEPSGGRAVFQGGVLNSNVSHRLTLRFDPVFKASQFVEIQEGNKPQLRISSVENPGQANVYSVLLCESVADYRGGK